MSEKRKAFALTALVLLIGLAGYAGCASGARLDGDEDRPPIVIFEASIHFANGYGWTEQNRDPKVWRPNQPRGKNVVQYDVTVTSNGAEACPPRQGKTVTIMYESRTFKLITKRHGSGSRDEPEVESPDALSLDRSGLILSLEESGKIKSVTVGNSPACDVSAKPGIRITAKPKN